MRHIRKKHNFERKKMDKPVIYTVGHSSHPIEVFLELLKTPSVNCLIDVRSIAASSYTPQYNQEPLSAFLKANGIVYLHFAKEFGARHTDSNLLDDERKVDFVRVRESLNFKNGIKRLRQGIDKGYCIALMCSEGDPLDCHRFSMISVALEKDGFDVKHILKDKTLKTTAELESQLLKKYEKKITQPSPNQHSLIQHVTSDEQLQAAYRLKNKEIAFSPYSKQTTQEHD
ncbi:DUF488 domain-containing protein [Verminephrobacter eiseniae]|uniref:DUF488 domain-containing protein n=1 Tax=Verminephrobacter eiseniae TaxID=364317 RepID=UPI002237F5FD|nr:DUF488 domain-containing protein [Verminephrobacter eiseniae]